MTLSGLSTGSLYLGKNVIGGHFADSFEAIFQFLLQENQVLEGLQRCKGVNVLPEGSKFVNDAGKGFSFSTQALIFGLLLIIL